jgi:hypothetical protein
LNPGAARLVLLVEDPLLIGFVFLAQLPQSFTRLGERDDVPRLLGVGLLLHLVL